MLNAMDAERARQLDATLRSIGTWKRVARRILQESWTRNAWSGERLAADGIATPRLVLEQGEEEEDDEPLMDHPGRCSDAHPGATHDAWRDAQEEEESRDAPGEDPFNKKLFKAPGDDSEEEEEEESGRYPGPRPVVRPLRSKTVLRSMLKNDQRSGYSKSAAATATWQRAVHGLLQPTIRITKAKERQRHRILREYQEVNK